MNWSHWLLFITTIGQYLLPALRSNAQSIIRTDRLTDLTSFEFHLSLFHLVIAISMTMVRIVRVRKERVRKVRVRKVRCAKSQVRRVRVRSIQ